jgi:trehalose/maltose hydrolase-like predicted phosphorylase
LLPPVGLAGPHAANFELDATQQDFERYFPTYLANGMFSAQSSLRGTDATLAQMAGLMDYTPDDVSRPAAIPSWTEIDYFDGHAWLNDTAVSAQAFQQYRQTLDMYDGTLTTRYVWADGSQSTRIAVTTFVSEDATHLAVTRLSLTPGFSGKVRLRFTLRPWPPFPHRLALGKLTLPELKRVIATTYHLPPPSETMLLSQVLEPATPTAANRAAIWYPGEVAIQDGGASDKQRLLWIRGHASHGDEVAEAAAITLASELGDPQVRVENSPRAVILTVEGTVEKARTYAFTKFVAASGGHWGGSEENRKIATAARTAGFETALKRHQASWHGLWKSDIQVEGDATGELQRSIHSDLFYILENSSVGTAWPMAANGFSPNYLDHIFWDNDSWDFPVMLLLHPERAKSQLQFRYQTLSAAQDRARAHGYEGAMYPWEADPLRGTEQTPYFAKENAEGEIHINGGRCHCPVAVLPGHWRPGLATPVRLPYHSRHCRFLGQPGRAQASSGRHRQREGPLRATARYVSRRIVHQRR